MKTQFIITVIGIFVLQASTIFAQINVGAHFSPQITEIFQQDDMTDGAAEGFPITFGMNYGIDVEYNLNKTFSIGSGISYSAQGSGLWGDDYEAYMHQDLHYLKLPVIFKVSTNQDKAVVFSAGLGIQAGFLVYADNFIWSDEHEYYVANGDCNLLYSGKESIEKNSAFKNKYYDRFMNIPEFYGFQETNLRKMYKSTYLAGVLELGLGYKITEKLKLYTNIFMDLGFTDIENKDYEINGEKFWTYWYDLSYDDYSRKKAYSINTGLMIKLNYRISG